MSPINCVFTSSLLSLPQLRFFQKILGKECFEDWQWGHYFKDFKRCLALQKHGPKNFLVSMGGRVEGLACVDMEAKDPGARTPISGSGNLFTV